MCPPGRNVGKSPWMHQTGLDDPSNMRRAFSVLDRDGDGKIAVCDLQQFLDSCPVGKNVSKEDIEWMITVADADRDGSVDLEEFERIIAIFLEEVNANNGKGISSGSGVNLAEEMWEFKELFRMMDRDGDGVVGMEDLKSFMNDHIAEQYPLREDDVAAMMEAACGSANSGVSYPDLVALVTMMMNGS